MSETSAITGHVELVEAAETPMLDMVSDLAREIELGWRLKAEALDGNWSHSCGRELSREVGRILRAHISKASGTPQ